jgi:osmotically-inducible protein OsmY
MEPRKLLTVCIVLFVFFATGVAADTSNEEMQSDLWLKAKIVTAYTLNQHLNPFKLDVEVKKGVAYLSGTVDSNVERDLAVQIAKGVEGISKVEEAIQVKPGAMAGERRESEFFRTVEDATITAKIKSKLLWNRNTKGLDINVTTKNAHVTLKGKVATAVHEDLAVELAKNTPGVERVENELVVSPQAGKVKENGTLQKMETKANDAWITTRVKSMLLFSKETQGASIDVSTTEQVVTLKGTVVSDEQKEAILKMVGDTEGVKAVRSQLVVEKG